VLIILSLTALSSCVYYNIFYNAKKYYKTAERENRNIPEGQLRTQNYQKAIDTAAKVPEMYPDSKYVDDALMLMGKCYYKIKQFPKAQRKFEELITNYPQSGLRDEANLYLGKSLIENKSFDRARDILTHLAALSENKIIVEEANFALGKLLFDEEKHIQAADIYRKIAESTKDKSARANAYYLAGECLSISENYPSAAEAFKKASEYRKSPLKQRYDTRYNWALNLRKTGNLANALEVLQAILKNQKFYEYFPETTVEIAEIIYEMGDIQTAVAELNKIIESNPKSYESARALYNIGVIHRDYHNDYDKAQENFSAVRTEKADSPYADSAQAALDIITDWRGVIRSIDSVKALIENDLNLLMGVQDSTIVDTATLDESQIRQLFEQGGPPPDSIISIPPVESIAIADSSIIEIDTAAIHPVASDTASARLDTSASQPAMTDSAAFRGDSTAIEPAELDTAAVLARINENHQQIGHLQFHLAEVLFFQMNNTDSSRTILSSLADSAEAALASKSLFLLAHTYKQAADTASVDSIYTILVERFNDTEYAIAAKKRLGLPVQETEIDSAEIYFKQAESLYFEQSEVENARNIYALVDSLFPQSPFAPKAIYARAWLAQYELYDDSLAVELLKRLSENYPGDTLAIIAQVKTTETETIVDISGLAFQDTTSILDEGEEIVYLTDEVDEPPLCQEDSLAISAIILRNNLYPSRARSANMKGLAILEMTINKYGYPEDIEIIKDIPPGYGFGDAAIEALEYLTFTPGKIGSEPVNVRIEQRIKFEL